MAKAYVQLPEEYLQKLSKLGNKTDEICEKMLKAGGEVVAYGQQTGAALGVGGICLRQAPCVIQCVRNRICSRSAV